MNFVVVSPGAEVPYEIVGLLTDDVNEVVVDSQDAFNEITEYLNSVSPDLVKRVSALYPDPAILCSPAVRPHLRRIVERFLPRCAVVSANELTPEVQVESIGAIAVNP